MNRPERQHAPRNYFSRREQWRVLLLVGALGVVLFLAREIRDGPTIGQALQAMFGLPEEDEIPRDADIDTRLQRHDAEGGIPGTFFSPREVQPLPELSDEYFPGVNPAYLESVRDDTFFRATEHDAWFHLLRLLDEADPVELAAASKGRVSFVQLFQQSSDYRGHVVRLRGTVRRAFPLQPPKNDYGIEQYYQLWLFPNDNPSSPVVLFCLNLPEGFPTGMTLVERAEVVGFYFKRLAYEAADTLRTAPTVLARGIQWKPAPAPAPVGPPEPGSPWTVFGVALVFSAALAAYVYWRTRSGRVRPDRPFTANSPFEVNRKDQRS